MLRIYPLWENETVNTSCIAATAKIYAKIRILVWSFRQLMLNPYIVIRAVWCSWYGLSSVYVFPKISMDIPLKLKLLPGLPLRLAGLLAWDKLFLVLFILLLRKFFRVSVSTGVPPPRPRLLRPFGGRPSSSEVGESEYLEKNRATFHSLRNWIKERNSTAC